jgi:hypothetical protein
MAKNESVLLTWQRDGLEIENFIFHIIAPDDPNSVDGVVPLDEVTLSEGQKQFFLERLKETSTGNKYLFLPDSVVLPSFCKALLTAGEKFVEVSRQITADFAGRHKNNMSTGVFVIAEVSVPLQNGKKGKLVYLVKLDHKKTLTVSYKDVGGVRKAVMDELPNALTESKSAVQKSALIDVDDLFAWDVLAWDKYGAERATKLSEYFEGFLGVGIHGTPAGLTTAAVKAIRTCILSMLPEELPEEFDRIVAKDRALAYLSGTAEFDTDTFVDSIVRREDAEQAPGLRAKLIDALGEAGVAGQRFTPEVKSLTRAQRKTVYKAAEGVSIQYEDGAGESIVEVKWADEVAKSGAATIIIRTRNLTVDA